MDVAFAGELSHRIAEGIEGVRWRKVILGEIEAQQAMPNLLAVEYFLSAVGCGDLEEGRLEWGKVRFRSTNCGRGVDEPDHRHHRGPALLGELRLWGCSSSGKRRSER